MKQNREYKYVLSDRMFIGLCIYYGILFVLGIYGVIRVVLLSDPNVDVVSNTLWGSFSSAMMFSSLGYLRRLYKAKIQNSILYNGVNNNNSISMGYFMYFILRPMFACALVLLLILALSLSLFYFTAPLDFVINSKFLYFSVVLSGLVGMSIGRAIDKFIGLSDKTIAGLLKSEDE